MKSFASGLLAGVVSAVIWMGVTIWVGLTPESVGGGALLFLVVVTLVSSIITALVKRGVRTARNTSA